MQLDSTTSDHDPTIHRCVVCSQPALGANSLCSTACLWAARRELEENRTVLQQPVHDPATRASLAARNGYLTSVLSRYESALP